MISKLTLKRQTLKPIITESKTSRPEKKEYVQIDNTPLVNNLLNKRGGNIPTQNTLKPEQKVEQQNKTNEVQKKLIDQMRNNLNQTQQKIIPDGFKQKKPYNKGNMKRRGGSFNF